MLPHALHPALDLSRIELRIRQPRPLTLALERIRLDPQPQLPMHVGAKLEPGPRRGAAQTAARTVVVVVVVAGGGGGGEESEFGEALAEAFELQ